MTEARLIEISTPDGIILPGALWRCLRAKTIVVRIPGLGGTFTSHLTASTTIAHELTKRGIALAVFNTRGSYTASSLRRSKRRQRLPGGEAFEHFTDCRHDLTGMVRAVRRLGYHRIFLLGHSTGANKAAYACSHGLHGVAGVVLQGAISDLTALRQEYGNIRLALLTKLARKAVGRGKGDELISQRFTGSRLFSNKRFLSLAVPGMPEDTFPYYDVKRKFPWVRGWRLPLMVLLGSRDQFLDRPARDLLKIFDTQCAQLRDYTSVMVHGADHGFSKHPQLLGRLLAAWVGERR